MLAITGDTFQHLGAAGLQLGQDTDDSNISGNVFTDISGNGLEIGNGTDADPSDVALLPAHNTIADNWVHNVAVEYIGGVGIFQGYTRYDVIEHNQINDVPYSGISSNWGWGRNPTETERQRDPGQPGLRLDAAALRRRRHLRAGPGGRAPSPTGC